MAVNPSVANAAANGDLETIQDLIRRTNADVNERSVEGMRPICIAAFWGYADVVQELLRAGADINATNTGTQWTALHCACFQGHGKVVMKLMDRQPDITLKDNQGRTAVDFASAQDSVWSFFAVAGCKRTLKSELVRMNIVRKLSENPSAAIKPYSQPHVTRLSRPGSAYVMATQSLCHQNIRLDDRQAYAAMSGDVLASVPDY